MLKKVMKIILMVLGGLVLAVLVAFLFGWIVMLLWNWLMPPIFGLSTITFWQSWGLVILSHILFKLGHHNHDHNAHRQLREKAHWKETFKDKMRAHFGETVEEPEASES